MTTRTSSAASSTNHRTIVYWGTTLLLAVECVVGGMMGALRLEPFIGIIRHLGYPAYFMTILSVWYVLAGLALLVPRLPRLKEWAYAGLIFNYTGAVGSRLAVGDGAGTLVAPIIFAGLTAASWALRPPTRRDLAANRAVFESAVSSRSGMITYWVTTTLVVAELALGEYGTSCEYHTSSQSSSTWATRPTSWSSWASGRCSGAVALLVPRFPRLKEWAYAGAVFTYTGAVGSHLAVGDGAGTLVAPTIFAALTAASWALRPPARRDLAPS
jgi:uncharacterized membrane protein YphA (DoxX/SURF4 family)